MLGIIVDQNSDPTASDNWAIVISGVVAEFVTASYNFVSEYTSAFDYAVDMTVGGQTGVEVGYYYDPTTDTFSASMDYNTALQADINALQTAYLQCLSDYNAAVTAGSTSQADAGVSAGLSDASATYSSNEASPFEALVALVQSGG
jgi:hypothetical protein